MDQPLAKILIVEDDTDMAETCRRIFTRAGFSAEAVYDGEAGLEKLRADEQARNAAIARFLAELNVE